MKKTITIKAKFNKPKAKSYSKKLLKVGAKVEKEHSPNKKVQRIITKHHADEMGSSKKGLAYYKGLKKLERSIKKKKR